MQKRNRRNRRFLTLLILMLSSIIILSQLRLVHADGEEYDYVDSQSNVDGWSDEGTHSSFNNMKATDSAYDTLQEAAESEGWVTPTGYSTSFYNDPLNAYDDNTVTYAYYDMPANSQAGLYTLTYIYGAKSIWSNQTRCWLGRVDTYINEVMVEVYNVQTSSYVTVYDGAGTWGAWWTVSFGSTYQIDKLRISMNNSHTTLSKRAYQYELDFFRLTDYTVDLEVQWENANYTREQEYLCIKTGTTGAEDVKVYTWTGSWQLLFTDLTTSDWNNISVSSYLTSSTFTIKFFDSRTTRDTSQDSWQVDSALLHTWTPNNSPSCGEFQAPSTVYANKFFFSNHTIQDVDGNTTIQNSTLTIVNGTATFLWVYTSNTFSELNDPNNYWIIDSGSCLRTYVNATSFKLSFKLKAYWNFSEGSISVNATVFDNQGDSGVATNDALFTFEDDLIVQSATISSNYANPTSSLSTDALVYYEGTATVPEDATGIVGYVELTGVVKDYDATINSSGYFTVSWNSEAILGNHSYNFFTVTDQESEQNQTAWNYVDTLTISITVADNRININTNASIGVSAVYDSDSTPFDGTLLLNETTYSFASACRHNYTVASVSGGTRSPITQINVNDAEYVVWDSFTIDIAVSDNRIDVNTNCSLSVTATRDFDGTISDGTIILNYTTYLQSSLGRWNYTVLSVSGDSYGITTISSNDEEYVVWDRKQVQSGDVSSSYVHVGDSAVAYFVLIYEYDLVNVTDGTVLLNGTAMTYNGATSRWEYEFTQSSLGSYSYMVTASSEDTYNITILNNVAGAKSCTFYANINFRTLDTDGNVILDNCIVYFNNGTAATFGESSNPSQSNGTAVVGETWHSQTVSNGWANWTGITNSTLQAYVVWHGLTVNTTFTFTMTGDQNPDIDCLCYPFVHAGVRYHVASDATISTASYSSYILSITFSAATSTYTLCATGPRPTYLLNVTYDLSTAYTTYLSLAHYGNATIKINYQSWGETYIKKTDKLMSEVQFVDQRLTMSFSGNGIGEVNVYCGNRGAPTDDDGFTTTSYSSQTFIGYYTFSGSEKTVWIQFSTGSGQSGGLTPSSFTPTLWVYVQWQFPEIIWSGQTVQGMLNVTWTGEQSIQLMLIQIDSPFNDWKIQTDSLPQLFTMNKTGDKGFALIFVNMTVPVIEPGTYNIPFTSTFATITTARSTSLRNFVAFTAVQPQAPIPNLLVFVFLGMLSMVAFAGITVHKKRS